MVTDAVNDDSPLTDTPVPSLERLALLTPTLAPATHTNSYLVGDQDFVLVEPASPYAPEQRKLEALVRARVRAGRRLVGIVLTHHHADHVGGAAALREAFGAPVMAHGNTRDKLQGRLAIDTLIDEGDATLGALGLEVLFTPGHAPGHVCLRHRTHGWIVVGDMVASVGTILIDPEDDGDMDAYLRELVRLRSHAPTVLLPAHGDPIEDSVARLGFYVDHRLAREAKVLSAVREGATELSQIVAKAYNDTSPLLWPLAARSARAHLERLRTLGRIRAGSARDQWKIS